MEGKKRKLHQSRKRNERIGNYDEVGHGRTSKENTSKDGMEGKERKPKQTWPRKEKKEIATK